MNGEAYNKLLVLYVFYYYVCFTVKFDANMKIVGGRSSYYRLAYIF